NEVASRRRRREGGRSRRDTVGQELVAASGERRGRGTEVRGIDHAGDDQLVRGRRRRERLREAQERLEAVERLGHHQQRSIRRCRRLHWGGSPFRLRQVEDGVLLEDRALEPLQLLAWVQAELL